MFQNYVRIFSKNYTFKDARSGSIVHLKVIKGKNRTIVTVEKGSNRLITKVYPTLRDSQQNSNDGTDKKGEFVVDSNTAEQLRQRHTIQRGKRHIADNSFESRSKVLDKELEIMPQPLLMFNNNINLGKQKIKVSLYVETNLSKLKTVKSIRGWEYPKFF